MSALKRLIIGAAVAKEVRPASGVVMRTIVCEQAAKPVDDATHAARLGAFRFAGKALVA